MKNQDNLVQTLLLAGALKRVKRTGWINKGVKDSESVADHTWRMNVMIMLLADDSLDKQKLLEMSTVHDMGEVLVGDIIWERGTKTIAPQKDKHRDEVNALTRLLGGHKKYVSLLNEYNRQKTKEARFLKQIDKLEMVLQALEYEKEGYPAHLMDEFWENGEKYLKGQSLEMIFKELKRLRTELQGR